MKRVRNEDMHPVFKSWISKITYSDASKLKNKINVKFLLGIDPKTPLGKQAYEKKRDRPDCIIMLQVGNSYECFGIDAVIVVDITKSKSMNPNGEIRTSIPKSILQAKLNLLTQNVFKTAIYEELKITITPRMRNLTQIVCEANPNYMFSDCLTEDEHEELGAKNVISVSSSGDSDEWCTLCCVDLSKRTIKMFDSVDSSVAKLMVQQASKPIFIIRKKPKWMVNDEIVHSGVSSDTNIVERTLQLVESEYSIPRNEIHRIPPYKSQCAPLSRFTASQLGLVDSIGTHSLLNYCIFKDSTIPIKLQMKRWLTVPPPEHEKIAITKSLYKMKSQYVVPLHFVSNPGKYLKILQNPTVMLLNNMESNTIFVKEQRVFYNELWESVQKEYNLECDSIEELCNIFTVLKSDVTTLTKPLEQHIQEKKEELDAIFEEYPIGTKVDDSYGLGLWLSCDSQDENECQKRLPVFDKSGNRIANRCTTQKIIDLNTKLGYLKEKLKIETDKILKNACAMLKKYETLCACVEVFVLYFATLQNHLKCVGGRWNSSYESKSELKLNNLVPYWIPGGINNNIQLYSGDKIIITGQNGFGKTTLMRAITATCLLSQCGLLVPCAYASIPYFSHIFLRSGGLDNALENKSSFENEILDITTMLTAKGPTLILLDEGCRSTNVNEGQRLLKNIIEATSDLSISIFSTHFDDLDDVRADWMQMVGTFKSGNNCKPSYKLEYGRCTQQYALEKALKIGLPIDIVLNSRKEDDVDTLVMAMFHKYDFKYDRFTPGKDSISGSPLFSSVLYVATIKPDCVYVGESDGFMKRCETHLKTKNIESFFMVTMENKTVARDYESIFINSFMNTNIKLYSLNDGQHQVKQIL